MTSSLPNPFCADSTAPCGNRCATGAKASRVWLALVATMPKSNSGRSSGVGRGLQVRVKFVVAGDANPALVDASRMFRAADQRPHLGDARQMRGVQAADGSGSDDEDAFQPLFPTTEA